MLISNLCNSSDAYIDVKGTKDLLDAAANEIGKARKDVVFKINGPFGRCPF